VPNILLCTVGTSLGTNLKFLKPGEYPALAEAWVARDPNAMGRELAALDASARVCGAEINSVDSMIQTGRVPSDVGIVLYHSATKDGRDITTALGNYFRERGHSPVEVHEIGDLQDADPKRFRTHGLRNLASAMCTTVRNYDASACAINATGGYKAQIAIAVILGQALSIPVYYKHEQFSEIIAFPPMPIALDYELWMQKSGLLNSLSAAPDGMLAASEFEADELDDKAESLIERESIDGVDYLVLSATGQIFYETFRQRFSSVRDRVMPPAASASQKQKPNLKSNEGHMLKYRDQIEPLLVRITQEVAPVTLCVTSWFQAGKSLGNRFRLTKGEVEGIWSNGMASVKFYVHSTSTTEGQKAALVAALNEWLANG